MKLEFGEIQIKDVILTNESKIENSVLSINEQEVKDLVLEDDRFASVEIEIAKPGESVRITPVKDVIEPRAKVDSKAGVFPGVINRVDTVGEGKTVALKGCEVMTAGKLVRFQEGIVDMSGPGAELTPFSKNINIVLVAQPVEGIETHAHEEALRLAGLKVANYLGQLGTDVQPDNVEVYETKPIFEQANEYPDLPKVGYVYMLQTQGLLHDTYVYGTDAKHIVPTILYPTEIMDGAIISGNCVSACDKNTTYHHLNNPIIKDLYARHGKDINFMGVIITNEAVYLADKQRSSDFTAKLAQYLGLDGAIVSQEGFGNPDTDLIMNCTKLEKAGVKTVIVTDEYAGRDGSSQSLADADPLADAAVTGGNANEVITLPAMDRIIGTTEYVDIIAGGAEGSLKENGEITVEIQAITGATNELGFNKQSARYV
ncbi:MULTISPECIES: glycine/sarcosine/betaine reductase component B subunit [Aerococcus]|uniref:Beta-aspartyl-peptidase n=3 Tax=Aerococcus TaxID=1375 RepID=A0A5N1GNN3_9LACT|nr:MULTISPECIES: glycine/sarcosine/betaine reductase component B subunit [Aerococcus]KAA9302014.1 beta-aspartyl-peptidase [Aerococcus sanguinicola]MDK6368561.1 glycine/sarcosine/betaine reductase component B subunit [Aerococcus sp. UMB9870]MDK6679644.1 glycine/sarcosine/betaine reductase component B subunit [Aerococcus sp. UMB8608]MDK6686488.1 glycine/sarcosine/betaine reductase component B subunit [Aerococcus sp. UMB8623]MDK6940890.1 glycine/sarcosine/betaine reductase component B subunit [Ae